MGIKGYPNSRCDFLSTFANRQHSNNFRSLIIAMILSLLVKSNEGIVIDARAALSSSVVISECLQHCHQDGGESNAVPLPNACIHRSAHDIPSQNEIHLGALFFIPSPPSPEAFGRLCRFMTHYLSRPFLRFINLSRSFKLLDLFVNLSPLRVTTKLHRKTTSIV